MAKQGAMGDNFYLDGFNLSGDVGSIQTLHGGPAPSEVTGIDKSAPERIGLLRNGELGWTSWFNDTAVSGAHAVLKALPYTDRIATYVRGPGLGRPAASIVGKQISYDGTRPADASFTFAVNMQSNGFGIEWGEQLTAGLVTQGAAGNGTGIDFGSVSTLFGWSAYLHLTAFTGTSITVAVQDSADNATFANLTGGTFTAATAVGAERIAGGTTATVRRYVRMNTTGVFSNATFHVNFVRYLTAQP